MNKEVNGKNQDNLEDLVEKEEKTEIKGEEKIENTTEKVPSKEEPEVDTLEESPSDDVKQDPNDEELKISADKERILEEETSNLEDNEYAEKLSKPVMGDYQVDFDKLNKLSDDEAIVELDKMTGKNDELIEKDYLNVLVNQKDRMIYYEVENIYNNPNKRTFQNRFKMRRNPPSLVIKDDMGNEAKFNLTENLTDELSETLRQVKRAYYGFHKPSDINVPEKLHDKIRYYIKNNPFKILSTIFLILFLLTLLTK